jgi:DNA-binding response OmpR family regulator
MIVHGDALERARGLDLCADDVVSFPFEPLEFGAKIRTQLRQKQPELKFEGDLKDALEREHLSESTAEKLISKVMSRRRFWVLSIGAGRIPVTLNQVSNSQATACNSWLLCHGSKCVYLALRFGRLGSLGGFSPS